MSGDYIDIGTECFASADGSVLCWRGVNYVPQAEQHELVEQFAAVIHQIADLEMRVGAAEAGLSPNATRQLRLVRELKRGDSA